MQLNSEGVHFELFYHKLDLKGEICTRIHSLHVFFAKIEFGMLVAKLKYIYTHTH